MHGDPRAGAHGQARARRGGARRGCAQARMRHRALHAAHGQHAWGGAWPWPAAPHLGDQAMGSIHVGRGAVTSPFHPMKGLSLLLAVLLGNSWKAAQGPRQHSQHSQAAQAASSSCMKGGGRGRGGRPPARMPGLLLLLGGHRQGSSSGHAGRLCGWEWEPVCCATVFATFSCLHHRQSQHDCARIALLLLQCARGPSCPTTQQAPAPALHQNSIGAVSCGTNPSHGAGCMACVARAVRRRRARSRLRVPHAAL